jgi:cytidine deaminase
MAKQTAASKSIPLQRLAAGDRYRHDIFIGLVAPIGSSKTNVVEALESALIPYGYLVEKVRLSDLLDKVGKPRAGLLPGRKEPGYHVQRMDAGDRLREDADDGSALAAVAVVKVAALREHHRGPEKPVAYVFDSLKHPGEAALLRNVYGPGFWLLAIVQDPYERLEKLSGELNAPQRQPGLSVGQEAAELIERDQKDPVAAHGQRVREVFPEAHFFLPIGRGIQWRNELDRFVRGVFDDPFLTPSRDEEAMRHAQAAALRSASIGRQVGAAIVPTLGAPIVVGTNEVPKPGGGQYREGDLPDHRDFQKGEDSNRVNIEGVVRDLFDRMSEAEHLSEDLKSALGDEAVRRLGALGPDGRSVLDKARIGDLIEFIRCMHAEEAAIADAARSGTPTSGARLYTTTFPCHLCTKLIIGAGIVEVQYIEPYPKSLAGELYADLIEPLPSLSAAPPQRDCGGKRVPFKHFTGFAPRRYDEVFCAPPRRSDTGLASHQPACAVPVGENWSEAAVHVKQAEVCLAIRQALEDRRKDGPDAGDQIPRLGA